MSESDLMDKLHQKAEWRTRLTVALMERRHDTETLMELVDASLRQAHSEGLRDAAEICHAVGQRVTNPTAQRTARTLSDSIEELIRRNSAIRLPASSP